MKLHTIITLCLFGGCACLPATAGLSNLDRKFGISRGGSSASSSKKAKPAKKTAVSKPAAKPVTPLAPTSEPEVQPTATPKPVKTQDVPAAAAETNSFAAGPVDVKENPAVRSVAEKGQAFLKAWKDGDDVTLQNLLAPTLTKFVLASTKKDLSNLASDEAIGVLFDAPDNMRDSCESDRNYYLVEGDKRGIVMAPKSENGKYGILKMVFTPDDKIENLVLVDTLLDESDMEDILKKVAPPAYAHELKNVIMASSASQLTFKGEASEAAGSNEPPATVASASSENPVRRSKTVGTWGEPNADFSDAAAVVQAMKMNGTVDLLTQAALLYKACRVTPPSPETQAEQAQLNQKMTVEQAQRYQKMAAEQAQLYQKMAEVSAGMPAELRGQMMTNLHARMVKLPGTEGVKLANTITILGEDREISRDDFYGRVSSPKLVWPQNAELALMAVQGNCVTAYYRFETFGYKEPIFIRTTLVLEPDGSVSAIGETQLTDVTSDEQLPRTNKDHGQYTWGKVDTNFCADAEVKKTYGDDSMKAYVEGMARLLPMMYKADRSAEGFKNRQNPSLNASGVTMCFAADNVTLLGLGKTVSKGEYNAMLMDRAYVWPDDAQVLHLGTQGNCMEMIVKMDEQGKDGPTYIKVLLILSQGRISAIGETQCYDTDPTLDAGFTAISL